MTPEQWQRVRPILESALELDPAGRSAFLDQVCADRRVRNEVESLISSHEQAGTDVLNPAFSPTLNPEDETRFRLPAGKRIGAYEILEEIAVGGMGAVYRAVRADGQYKQQVAVKIVRPELGAELMTSRFKNERQILASLNHPNIAKILDGGTTAEGVPYFVMELVEGQRIDKYCDGHKLTTNERLNLFLEICSAVQYAHQHLIIHRDIKPGNIVVNAEMVPKLLDFGIAKILESSEASNQPEQTISLVRLLTPEYASPEQIKGEPITTASDVYSLGVVLYELLTGGAPYNVPTHTPHELSRAVCETEPERPSMAVLRKQLPSNEGERRPAADSSLTATPEGSPEKLSKRLSGDLDNIVLMALRKEPQRRYVSVEQFAQDIRRHLEHLPVIAHKDTFGYKSSKFITRHKVGVAAAVLVTLALLSATAITLRQARIARAERARAERRFNDVRKLANSLIFEVHDSIRDLAGSTPARQLIIEKGLQYLDTLAKESNGDPSLQRELAIAYTRIGDVQGLYYWSNSGDTAGAMKSYQKALDIFQHLAKAAPKNVETQRGLATGYEKIAMILMTTGETNEALAQGYQALAIREMLVAAEPQSADALYRLAGCHNYIAGVLWDLGDLRGTLKNYEDALAEYQSLLATHPESTEYRRLAALMNVKVSGAYLGTGQLQESIQHGRQAVPALEVLASSDPSNMMLQRNLAVARQNLGHALVQLGDLREGQALLTQAAATEEILSTKDPANGRLIEDLSFIYTFLGDSEVKKGRKEPALRYYAKALQEAEQQAKRDPLNELPQVLLAQCYRKFGEFHETAALRSHLPRERQAACRDAQLWFQKALQVLLKLNEKVHSPRYAQEIEQVQHSIATCDAPPQ